VTAKEGWQVTRKFGTHQGKEVEVWAATRTTRESTGSAKTKMFTVYIDVQRKLPIGFTEGWKEPNGSVQLERDGEFTYPKAGPADIYQAGAPKSAQIKPAPEQ
jgi:hypothetical protein